MISKDSAIEVLPPLRTAELAMQAVRTVLSKERDAFPYNVASDIEDLIDTLKLHCEEAAGLRLP